MRGTCSLNWRTNPWTSFRQFQHLVWTINKFTKDDLVDVCAQNVFKMLTPRSNRSTRHLMASGCLGSCHDVEQRV